MSTMTPTADTSRAGKKKKSKGLNAGQGRRGLVLVAPSLLVLTLIIIYPLVKAVSLSFTKDAGLDPATGLFVEGGSAGLDNYKHWLLQQCGTTTCPPGTLGAQFYDALNVTIFWTVVTVTLETLLGLWFATIMNREFKGRGLVRAAILVPWAIPTAVTAKLWFFMFAYEGIVNKALGLVGVQPLLWTGSEWPAKFAIIIADTWKTAPFMALLILAGLQLVPGDVYEAAQIDGANKWQVFTKITLPLIKTPLMVAVLFRTLDVLRIYDLPAILTQGGGGSGHATTSLSILVVKQIRAGFHSASALSTIVFLIIAFTAFLFIKFGGAEVVQRPPSAKKGDDEGGAKAKEKLDAANIVANAGPGK